MVKRLVLLMTLITPTMANASTILQFTQLTFGQPFHVTTNGVTSAVSAVNVPVNVIFDTAFCAAPGCGGATNGTYLLNLTANSTNNATNTAGTIRQDFAGTISITNGAINLLTVNFGDIFTGPAGASSNISMGSAQPPDTFTGSSTVFDPLKLGTPRGFALSFSNFTPGLGTNGTTINAANMDATGTINATPQNPIPEPASLTLLGLGLVGIGVVARKRLKQ